MGNEDKINGEIARGESPFLPDEIHDVEGIAEVYSLEKEFAKAKKNKNYKLYLFIVLFIGSVVGGSLLVTYFLESRGKDVTVDIDEFEDLRLKEVIESARKRGNNVDLLRIRLQILEVQMLNNILDVKMDYYRKEMDVLSQNLPDAENNERISYLRKEEGRKISEVERKYRNAIRRQKYEIAVIEREREKEEQEVKEKGGDSAVSNVDRLFALKMKDLKEEQELGTRALKKYYDRYIDYLVLMYNPIYRSKKIDAVMASGDGASIISGDFLMDYPAILGRESLYSPEDFKRLREYIAGYNLMLKRTMRVPYRNSVPLALRKFDTLAGAIIREYEAGWKKTIDALEKKNKEVAEMELLTARYVYPFDFIVQVNMLDGIVIDPRDKNKIIVHLNKSLSVREGDTASVLRGEKPVGRIQFFRDDDGMMKARILSLAGKGLSIQTTNIIVVDKKK